MFAIIKTGGKQYRVSEGDEIFIERLPGEAGEELRFEEVLAVGDEGSMVWGTPFVEGAVVTGELVKQGKGKKVVIFKMKSKKAYRRKNGHRQPYTRVKITKIAQ